MNKRDKIRLTNQRTTILEELKKVRSHPTAYEIHEMVKDRLPSIALGTVYRNLDFLSQAGIIRQLEAKGGKRRFDGNPDPHYHISCIACGHVDDVEMPVNKDLEEMAARASGYEVIGHRVEFKGICAECRKAREKDL